MHCDVAIVGGGPGGSTLGTLLRKYDPTIKVAIFEREVFPRDHVGESQLPGISAILSEMGVWDKVEAAGFPIKIGATYRWGKSPELWDFQFFPKEKFVDEVRPAKYQGQRTQTAFQVDRAVYDKILLDHARECGCLVHEGVAAREVSAIDGKVQDLTLADGTRVTADHYVDASGHPGFLRRALGVPVSVPTNLQNVAFWDYWQNAKWAVEVGVGGTFVQVLSVGYGWIWFIPLGPTRTSVGLIVPAAYLKESGKSPQELYSQALHDEERVRTLMLDAVSEGRFSTTKDWSFVAEKHAGPNWFLVGESGGFADPILAAGLTITHAGAREAACTILELRRGTHDGDWLRAEFQRRQLARIHNHIRFADFWYTSNGQFTDLQAHTAQLARESGLDLDPQKAWAWLAQGGFIDEDLTLGTGGYSLDALRALPTFLTDVRVEGALEGKNRVALRLDGAEKVTRAFFGPGVVQQVPAYVRGQKVLPLRGVMVPLMDALSRTTSLVDAVEHLKRLAEPMRQDPIRRQNFLVMALRGLEALVYDGWCEASHDPTVEEIDLTRAYFGLRWSDEQTIGQAGSGRPATQLGE